MTPPPLPDDSAGSTAERIEVQRTIPAEPARVFAVLRDPQGHVTIDASGMLMDATGEPASKPGDQFVVHMDRQALNDYPIGRYDVTVSITAFDPDREVAWTVARPRALSGSRLRLHPRAGRRGHISHLVLRLVGCSTGHEGRGDLPRHLRDRTAGHARNSRADPGAVVRVLTHASDRLPEMPGTPEGQEEASMVSREGAGAKSRLTRSEWYRVGGMAAVVVVLNVVGWGLLVYAVAHRPQLSGTRTFWAWRRRSRVHARDSPRL